MIARRVSSSCARVGRSGNSGIDGLTATGLSSASFFLNMENVVLVVNYVLIHSVLACGGFDFFYPVFQDFYD